MTNSIEVKTEPPRDSSLLERVLLIFTTGFSEIRRKGTVTRLHFEIKGFEREKEKYVHALGLRAWEAHLNHPDLAPIVIHLKELQIETNRLKSQFGEHDTEIKDIQQAKTDLTATFNQGLDGIEQQIVPHRQRIESINAEKEDNKKQIEELRAKQEQFAEQIRLHQQNIQKLDLADESEKSAKIRVEQDAIRKCRIEESEIDCSMPLLLATVERLKNELASERAQIQTLEEQKEISKRDYEQKIKDFNTDIRDLEEKKKQATRQMARYTEDMDPFLYDLGKKVEQLRLETSAFTENYTQLDGINGEIATRERQILEAQSLSRAMDRGAWNGFLVFSGTMIVVLVSTIFVLLH